MKNLFLHRTLKEEETNRRIKISIWAYSYEFEARSLVPDSKFDEECKKINLLIDTDRPDLDKWFRKEFRNYTGQWIHKHPELSKIKRLYNAYYI